jgi:hypothetical protein
MAGETASFISVRWTSSGCKKNKRVFNQYSLTNDSYENESHVCPGIYQSYSYIVGLDTSCVGQSYGLLHLGRVLKLPRALSGDF